MEATIFELILAATITLIVIGTSICAYLISTRHEKVWFYVYAMMLIVLVQWMSDTGAALIYHDYYLHLASVILFPSIIFCLFIVYVLQGSRSVKNMLYVLLIGEVGYVMSVGFLAILNNIPIYLKLDWPWISNHLFSTLAVIIDYAILLTIWPIIHNIKYKLPIIVKVFLVCLLLLIMDSLVFTIGTFWKSPLLLDIISANIIIRASLSILITPLISIYISSITKNNANVLIYHKWNSTTIDLEQQIKFDKLQELQQELTKNNIDLQNQRKAIINVLEDVEKEKATIEDLAKDLEKFKLAVEHASDHIVITDPDGIILYANEAVSAITGFSREYIIGKKAGSSELWGGLMDNEVYKNFWNKIKNNKQPFFGEFNNHRNSGEAYIAEAHVSPILNEKGEVTFFVGIERDITHAKEVDRMKTDFISLASHQLRTPLSAMKWFIEMLMAGDMGELNKEQKEAVDNLEQSNERMISLVNGLLNISRIESGRIIIEPELTNITQLTELVTQELAEKFVAKKQSLIVNGDKAIPPVLLDSKLIRQVIINLLTNANKYTPEGGKITILISQKNNEITIQISDNGYGIPENEQGKIFGRFFRATNVTKLETDGTGLGLYLAKAIIESSGGKIWFRSKVGEGTSFWFTLPITGMQARAGEVRLDKENY